MSKSTRFPMFERFKSRAQGFIKGSQANANLEQSRAIRPTTSERSGKLCQKCRQYGLNEAHFYCELSEDEMRDVRMAVFDRWLIATDCIRNLSDAPDCPFCYLVLCALQEQHDFAEKSIDGEDPYRLEWLYVPRNINRHADKDSRYVRFVQVLSPANSGAKELAKGHLRFEEYGKRKPVRSLIAPVEADSEVEKFLKVRKVDRQIDINVLRRQLDSCHKWHGKYCKEMTGEAKHRLPSTSFMLIDVVDMCLVSPIKPRRYVALSYVWGANGENSFLTTVSNVSGLRRAGMLRDCWDDVPNTIQDAITLVQELGERYLWVDSLCIIQDDASSKQGNINSMSDVYVGASFTIIAATGEHAKAGLPGVRPGSRRRTQRRAVTGDSRQFALLDDVELLLNHSPWVKRGWTFQEWFYASRCLIFLDGEVVFSCRYATWREGVIAEEGKTGQIKPLNDSDFSCMAIGYELRQFRRFYLARDLARDIGDILMNTIHEYRKRKLTYDSDILNAFQGVLADSARLLKSQALMGMPVRILDWGVLVQAQGTRRTQFPSWSWVAWTGLPTWMQDGDLSTWVDEQCWIVWHHRGIAADTITREDRNQTIRWKPTPEVLASTETEDWNELPFAARVQWQTFKHGRTTEATPVDLPPSLACDANIPANLALLQFWTYSTKLRLSKARDGWANVALHDCDGVECGSVVLCSGAVSASKPFEECEVLILSEARWARAGSSYVRHKDRKTLRDPARELVDVSLNVLLVSWNGPVAEKVGVGQIYQETVHFLGDHGMVWKEIILA